MLCVDNTSALKLIKNPEFHQRSKHIDVKYHFLRDLYNKSEIDVTYVKSEEQLANIFTMVLRWKLRVVLAFFYFLSILFILFNDL